MGRDDADRPCDLRKIQFIEDSKAGIDYENIQVVKYPERKYIPIGAEEELYAGESFYFYPTLYFMGKIARNLERFLQMPFQRKMRRYDDSCRNLCCGVSQRAYEEIQDSFKRIKEWGRNLNLEDTILALNIIDQFVEQDNDNYSTRIEVRIADTK